MNPVVHFEMPYDNRERMAKFYGSAFGWQTQMLGEEMGNYVIATTTDTDESGPKTRQDQWRLFRQEGRLARATPVDRHRGGRYRQINQQGRRCGRSSARVDLGPLR